MGVKYEARSDWEFSRMLIIMSVKPILTDELLKVNSALRPVFSVIVDPCSGGRTMKVEMGKTALQNKLTSNNYSSNGKQTAERLLISSNFTLF